MARILLLGTWMSQPELARDEINRRNEGRLSFGGMAGQMEISGPRIAIERGWIVNDRTWKHGMPRSVIEGRVEEHGDALFVVVDEPPDHDPRRGGSRRGA